ncbi:hypothetical protein IC627_09695 [Photobacterium damselae subsp. piscicida]|uniref:Uncharacterized protein n=1 Tax=Photobacterium damsela subsp. piscicida TaxID=38294 RepID=A0A7L8A1J5_PHODP|nr:hypothetical protein IC627_09695 [Photobacterium damselae subsp. piscicida]
MSYNKLRNISLIPTIGFGMITTWLTLVSVVDTANNSDAVLSIIALILFTILTTLVRYLTLPILLEKHENKYQEIMVLSGFVWFLNLTCFLMLFIESKSLIMVFGMLYLLILFIPIEKLRLNFWRRKDV